MHARRAAGHQAALADKGVVTSPPLGFRDEYAIAVRREVAERLGLRTLSDLAAHPELRLGLSDEFLARADGWPALRERYGLQPQAVRGMDHDLAWRGLASGAIDVMDAYTTDAEAARPAPAPSGGRPRLLPPLRGALGDARRPAPRGPPRPRLARRHPRH